jgi:hypothetical protein
MARNKAQIVPSPGYPERLRINADDGYSTFDKYLSPQTPKVGPEGGVLQNKCRAQSYNECEVEEQSRKEQWSPDYAADCAFNDEQGSGGSTVAFPKRK